MCIGPRAEPSSPISIHSRSSDLGTLASSFASLPAGTRSLLFLQSVLLEIPIMSKTFSQADVTAHKKPDDLWIIVDEDVYDLTKFQTEHPGKSQISKVRSVLEAPD